jgi:hypothetical protein
VPASAMQKICGSSVDLRGLGPATFDTAVELET